MESGEKGILMGVALMNFLLFWGILLMIISGISRLQTASEEKLMNQVNITVQMKKGTT